ncbi:unnamed protein product [Peniophora sp. CBMAI 1063]|nr:unnamed protein product [Peniophora sp. CBMAI 1063]
MASSTVRKYLSPDAWRLTPAPSSLAPAHLRGYTNADMDPVPPEGRKWTTFSYIAYWTSDATSAAVWQLSSSMLALGLSWRQAVPAIAVGHTVIACVMVLNGTVGARLHIPFPVLNRSSFGFWLSYFSVISRVILSMFWFGIQAFTGSECVYQMLKAIWPSLAHLPNHLPESSHITTAGIMCYFLYWMIVFPLMFVSPQRIRWLFVLKSIIVPPTWIAMLIWAFVKVPPSSHEGLIADHATLHGSSLSWAWLTALNSAFGIYATLAVNIPDFTRYAVDERAQYVQLIIIPIFFTFFSFIGVAVTSAGQVLYGATLWDPLRLIDRWDNRAAAFFAAFSFIVTTLGTNVSANTLSVGNDMTALAPRWINIRRGQILCVIIGGWALAPWEILASARGFLTFINGYTVFLGPIAGVMIADYWIVHRGKVDVVAMYDPHGRYRYTGGVNWRALAALLCSVPPNMPGLIHSINPSIPVRGAIYVFDVAYLFGLFTAGGVYTLLSYFFPAQETMLHAAILDLDDAKTYASQYDDAYARAYGVDRDDKSEESVVGEREEKEKEDYDAQLRNA